MYSVGEKLRNNNKIDCEKDWIWIESYFCNFKRHLDHSTGIGMDDGFGSTEETQEPNQRNLFRSSRIRMCSDWFHRQ